MIYTIKYDGETICSSVGDSTQMLYSASLEMRANEAGELNFSLPFGHQSYGIPVVSGGIVSVERNNQEMWCGRVAKKTVNKQKTETYTCEGITAIFEDVPLTVSAETTMMLSSICAVISSVTGFLFVPKTDFGINIGANAKTVMDAFSGFISKNGGYLLVRHINGYFQISRITAALKTASQVIREGDNLTDIQIVTERSGLTNSETSLNVSAFDKAYLDVMESPFDLYDEVAVESASFGVSTTMLLTEIKTELSNPSASIINLGRKNATITSEIAKGDKS